MSKVPVKNVFQQKKLSHVAASKRVKMLSAQFQYSMAQKDYSTAAKCCENVLNLMPDNLQVMSDYALSLMRAGNYMKSYIIYRDIYLSHEKHTLSNTWLDGLAEVCGWLGKSDEMRRYGNESLSLSDIRFGQTPCPSLPLTPIPPINLDTPEKNIISFSLYGNQPRYCETLVKNVEVAKSLFPAWRCRIYLDNSVPHHIWTRLLQADAQLVDMSHEKHIYPTLWRFLVIDDPQVERFLIRDADSLLSEREQAAIEEWVRTPYWFHHMRDYFTHTELLLAGMWAGYGGLIQNVEGQIRSFMESYRGNARFTDQYFLKVNLWPTVRQSILNHDELFDFHRAQPWPSHSPVRWETTQFHVGSNAGYCSLSGPCVRRNAGLQPLYMITQEGKWQYEATVVKGQWSLIVPFFVAEDVRAGKTRIELIL